MASKFGFATQSNNAAANAIKCIAGHVNSAIAKFIDDKDFSGLNSFVEIYGLDIYAKHRGISHIARMVLGGNLNMVAKYNKSTSHSVSMYLMRVAIGTGSLEMVKFYAKIIRSKLYYESPSSILYRAVRDGKLEIAKWLYGTGSRMYDAERKLCTDLTPEMQKWVNNTSDIASIVDYLEYSMPILE